MISIPVHGRVKEQTELYGIAITNYSSYSPVNLNRHSTHKAIYLAPANMHTNHHLLTYSGCHYCKQVL